MINIVHKRIFVLFLRCWVSLARSCENFVFCLKITGKFDVLEEWYTKQRFPYKGREDGVSKNRKLTVIKNTTEHEKILRASGGVVGYCMNRTISIGWNLRSSGLLFFYYPNSRGIALKSISPNCVADLLLNVSSSQHLVGVHMHDYKNKNRTEMLWYHDF